MDNHDEMEAFARELIIFGAVWGFGAGWALYAYYRRDWPSVAVAVLAVLAFFAYCRYREQAAIDIGRREEVRDGDV